MPTYREESAGGRLGVVGCCSWLTASGFLGASSGRHTDTLDWNDDS